MKNRIKGSSYKLALLVMTLLLTGLLAACGGDATAIQPSLTTSAATSPAATTPATTALATVTPQSTTAPTSPTAQAVPTQPTVAPTTQAAPTTQSSTGGATTTQPTQSEPAFEDRTSPQNLIKAFYNAIDRKEYQRAYGYWQFTGTANTPANYDQFAKGYADTASVAFTLGPIQVGAAAGNLYASIPTVLVATHTNGSKQTFAGCYVAHRTNDGISPNPDDVLWRLNTGKLALATTDAKPDPASCNGVIGDGSGQPASFEDRTSPQNLIKSFYNAIDRKEYQRAYGYWQTTGTTNTPANYAQFAKGYADTLSVTYTLGTVVTNAGAGNIYANIPTVLTATHTDGSKTTFAGCYVAHRVNDGISANPQDVLWRLTSGTLKAAPAGATPDSKSCP